MLYETINGDKNIIMDIGSQNFRIGMNTELVPAKVFPNCVGRSKHPQLKEYARDLYFGDHAFLKDEVLEINFPVKRGRLLNIKRKKNAASQRRDFDNFEDFEDLVRFGYSEVGANPEEFPVVMTEAVNAYGPSREKMTEIMMEKFNVPMVHFGVSERFACIGSGRFTGLVCDIGHGVTHTVPVFEGLIERNAVGRLDIAGIDVDNYLKQQFEQRGYPFKSGLETELVRTIRERYCYVADDYDAEVDHYNQNLSRVERRFILPDGEEIKIGMERFLAPEILFNPNILDKEWGGVHAKIYDSISNAALDNRKELYENIIICGGFSSTPGLMDRIYYEVSENAASEIFTYQPVEKEFLNWIGAAIFSTFPGLQDVSVTKEDYGERGAAASKKCSARVYI
eukprot:TRINITY_DN3689_c0_g2_i1.p1 TRINITY_DN3689_c0_g2~~TRINITY_DN3689_c0_g2_i1.p1  ORF type:complete len:396 (+),score=100.67 TRINITY_DN3689_c0_g2_i1:272-1459(+)